jgi:hypothetical protein
VRYQWTAKLEKRLGRRGATAARAASATERARTVLAHFDAPSTRPRQ